AYFGDWSRGSFFVSGGTIDTLLPLLSIANDGFFLLTALVMLRPSEVPLQRRRTFRVCSGVLLAFGVGWWLDNFGAGGSFSIKECIEAVFTAVVLIMFGAALTKVVRGCATSLAPIRWPWFRPDSRYIEVMWPLIGTFMITSFFGLYALLQLTIPLW